MFRKLPLNALRSFESASRLGSLRDAADELSVTPAAVSLQIRNLEVSLGVKLFDRLRAGLSLTNEGRLLSRQVHQTFSDLSAHLDRFVPDAESGIVRVTTTPSFAALWLIPKLGSFYSAFPDHSVRIETSNEVLDIETDSSFDLAIRSSVKEYPDLHQIKLMTEEFGVFVSPNYANVVDQKPRELIDPAWYGRTGCPASWAQWCSKAGYDSWLEDARFIEYDDEHYALQAAIAGQGYILASLTLAGDSLKRGLLVQHRGDVTIPGASFLALCTPGRERRKPVRQFLDWLVGQSAGT
ncbi:transcriptional regulator, LysR family [Halopseudomonas xinjiangensis]|uniref:Transcriptional regulator, LysR family n=1 Tax=Halopseudomonas xinjiangensis TaxID=487184 RepID=A0A1H1SSR2_9GAMM|nr:LysR substrate-binding domain-containing protein [Halopseudomonas xinjiangensis]SDS50898.1 transcriptional regulator, LysR family [Halopseudomonas xinjiangensis]